MAKTLSSIYGGNMATSIAQSFHFPLFFCIISHQHHILYLFHMISIFILKPTNATTNNNVVHLQADLVLVKHIFSHIDVVRLWILSRCHLPTVNHPCQCYTSQCLHHPSIQPGQCYCTLHLYDLSNYCS